MAELFGQGTLDYYRTLSTEELIRQKQEEIAEIELQEDAIEHDKRMVSDQVSEFYRDISNANSRIHFIDLVLAERAQEQTEGRGPHMY